MMDQRRGFNTGGWADDLTGQALAVYNSMTSGGHDDAAIQAELESQGLWTQGSTPGENVTGIINQNIGGGGGGGIGELDLTFTEGAKAKTLPGLTENQLANKEYWQNQNWTPEMAANKAYWENQPDKKQGILSKAGDMWDSTKDFFSNLSTPKVRGTLGDRLSNKPSIPLPAAMASWSMSPFNEKSRNYNPNFVDQLNFLETQDNMIGRDPNSGLMKYGPDSVLAGKNVISMFGTNDYEEALQNKIDWFENRISLGKKISWDNYHKALAEQQKANVLENERQKALQEKIAQEAMKGKSLSEIGKENFTGEGMAFAPRKDTYTGGKTVSSSSVPGGKYGSPKKDGGLIAFNRGGVASMFMRKR